MSALRIGALVLLLIAGNSFVAAQTFPWTGNGATNNWSEAANWNSPTAPPEAGGSNVRLEFALGSSSFTPNNDLAEDNPLNPNFGTFTLESMLLAGSSNPYSITGETLRFAGNAAIDVLAGPHLIANAIQIPVALETNVGGQLELNGNLSGAANVTKTGGGTLVLDGNNGNWTGDLDIQRGTVRFDPGDALSVNTDVNIAAGATADFSPSAEGFGAFSGAGHVEFGNIVDMFSHFTTTETFSGTVAGPDTHLRKQGPGTLILDGVIAGPAEVTLDRLTLEGGSISLTGTAQLNIDGTLELESGTTLTASGLLNISTLNDVMVRDTAQLRVRTAVIGPANIVVDQGGTLEVLSGATVAVDGGSLIVFSADDLFIDTGAKLIVQNGSAATVGAGANTAPLALSLFAELEVTGAGTTWTGAGLSVGHIGTGGLTIADGANVSTSTNADIGVNAGSTGTATVTGAGSTWTHDSLLNVAINGNGTLNIENGGNVSNTDATVRGVLGAFGSVNVTGAGSTWTSTGLVFIDGSVTVSDGGQVNALAGLIGRTQGTTGAVTVTGPGSTWNSTANLLVGDMHTGMLTIENGGNVSNNSGVIGAAATAVGTASVGGAGATWTMAENLSIGGNVVFGNGGTGSLTIDPGGTVDVAEDVVLFPNGTLTLQGGTLSASELRFESGGDFDFVSGTLNVGSFVGNLNNPAGTLAPGDSPGQTIVDGNYTQGASATLQIEIGGTQPAVEHDFVDVLGDVVLDGLLELSLLNEFQPDPASTFGVLDSQSMVGAFANVANGARLATTNGGSFLVHYGAGSAFAPTQIVLSDFQLAGLPGDFNNDGTVNAADYTVWRDHLGAVDEAALNGNGDGLGGVDAGDYMLWRNNFGLAAAAAAQTPPVPEPHSCVFACLAALVLATFRKKGALLCHEPCNN